VYGTGSYPGSPGQRDVKRLLLLPAQSAQYVLHSLDVASVASRACSIARATGKPKVVVPCQNKIILKNFIPEPPPSDAHPIFFISARGSIMKCYKIILKHSKTFSALL